MPFGRKTLASRGVGGAGVRVFSSGAGGIVVGFGGAV